ncbi:protein translocase subunit SecF [Candidatus Gottesmanbacteria bacterium]|nr:protein translocase subunit SecF [Candidatus Gottesmanbacteria bacterium]
MFDIIGKKWFYFIFSGLIIMPGIISLFLWGIRPAIDFTGGTLLELEIKGVPKQSDKITVDSTGLGLSSTESAQAEKIESQVELPKIKVEEIKKIVESQGIEVGSIQASGERKFLFRLKPIDKDQNKKLQSELEKQYGEIKEIRLETVGPSVGKETTQNAFYAVLIACVVIIFYIAIAFRQIPKPYSSIKFGICAVIALIHDVFVIVGLFSLFGHFFRVEVDSLFITALLTIMGFSVHDTIVVFDRIRENMRKMPGVSFAQVVNESIIQTLARSFSTSLTVLFTLFALLLFGGVSIRWFVIALLIGVISGTYSSIFNAAPLLVVWQEWNKRNKL